VKNTAHSLFSLLINIISFELGMTG
jgi:hypothetical protein